MTKRKGGPPKDYVGYRHPPKHTQFQPGESGNPRGRPKGTRSIGTILQTMIGRRIAVTENGKTRQMTALEVALLRLTNDAMRGEPVALKFLLSLVDRYGASPETKIAIEQLVAEDRDILAAYLAKADSTPGRRVSKRDGEREA